MISDAFPLMIGFLLVLVALPLFVLFPMYIFRFIKLRKIAREKGPQFSPSPNLKLLFSFLFFSLMVMGVVFPEFLKFSSGCCSPEYKSNLGAIFTAQVAYFGEYNTYAGRKGENGSGAFTDVDWRPEGTTRYAYYIGGDFIRPMSPDAAAGFEPMGKYAFTIRPEVSGNGFTALAVGNIDNDPCLDVWMIGEGKVIEHLIDDKDDAIENDAGTDCMGKMVMTLAERGRAHRRSVVIRKIQSYLVYCRNFGIIVPLLMVFALIIIYHIIISQNRLYGEARAAMNSGPASKPRA